MSIDATLISTEMSAVRDTGQGAHYRITVQLYVNKQWLEPLRVDSYSVERDYESGFADVRVLSLMLMYGQYTYDILPYRGDLQVDITYIPIGEVDGAQVSSQRSFTRRYRAFLMDTADNTLSNTTSQRSTREALNRMPPIATELQLVEEYIYEIQMCTVGRKFRQETPYNALRSVLTTSLSYVQGKDEKRILGVNTRGLPNQEKRTQVVIPDGTPIGKVASWLQDQEGGVFSAGLGCYLQDQYWYIYPLYDTKHASNKARTLTVYNVPMDRFNGTERTYRETENRVVVLTSGDATSMNLSENMQVQSGNGLRFLDARKILTDFGVGENNRMLVDRASNLFEVVGKTITKGVNNIQWAATMASGNPFKHYSALARLDGQVVVVEWRHGDVDLLDPGMLVDYMAIAEGKIHRYKGVLLGTHEIRIAAERGAQVSRHPSIVRLKLFIENKPLKESTPGE